MPAGVTLRLLVGLGPCTAPCSAQSIFVAIRFWKMGVTTRGSDAMLRKEVDGR